MENTNETVLITKDALDVLLAAYQKQQAEKAITDETKDPKVYFKQTDKDGNFLEDKSIGVPEKNVAAMSPEEGKTFNFRRGGFMVSVDRDSIPGIKAYDKAVDAKGKLVVKMSDLSDTAAREALRGIEKGSMILEFTKNTLEDMAKKTVDKVRGAMESVKDSATKGADQGKEAYEAAKKEAIKKYEEIQKSGKEKFEQSKKSLFQKLTSNLEYAQMRLRDAIRQKVRPFIRARDAALAALDAGKKSWEASKPKDKAKSLALKTPVKEEKAKTNERPDR